MFNTCVDFCSARSRYFLYFPRSLIQSLNDDIDPKGNSVIPGFSR